MNQKQIIKDELLAVLASHDLTIKEADEFTYLEVHTHLSQLTSKSLNPLYAQIRGLSVKKYLELKDEIDTIVNRCSQDLRLLIDKDVDEDCDKEQSGQK
ncbi:MAG: hypothetical protein KAV87_20980 [Desulfobacteraceae bacterium]|nr:hypothetical protein [Desulfobacteraceae bacterium]